MALTEAKIRALKPKAKAYRTTDANRLYLQVTPSGGKHWRFGYTFRGKQKTLSLGSYPLVNLSTARVERDKAKKLLKDGIDPSAAKKAAGNPSEPVATGETFGQVALRWLKLNQKKWVSAYYSRLRSRMDEDIIPHLGDKPIAAITAQDVLATIRKIEERGAIEMARRIRQMVSQVFRFAVAEGLIQHDPARDIGDALMPKPAPKRRSALPADEIPAFLAKVREYEGEVSTIYGLQLIAHTAVRTQELRMAEWQEFEGLDGEDPLWRIPAEKMKMRNHHVVPLTPQAVAILKELKPLTGHQRWVFLSGVDGADKPMSNNTLIFSMYRLGYHSRATVHGFRSSFSTWANENGHAPDIIERCLAHTDSSVRAVYNRAAYLPQRRELMTAWSNYIDPISDPEDFDDLL